MDLKYLAVLFRCWDLFFGRLGSLYGYLLASRSVCFRFLLFICLSDVQSLCRETARVHSNTALRDLSGHIFFSTNVIFQQLAAPLQYLASTAKTQYRKFETYIPSKWIPRPQSQFYINHSQAHECGNWDWGRAIPFLEIDKWYFRCSVPVYPSPEAKLYNTSIRVDPLTSVVVT